MVADVRQKPGDHLARLRAEPCGGFDEVDLTEGGSIRALPGRWPIDAGVARLVRSLGRAFVETVRPSELHVILYAFHSKP